MSKYVSGKPTYEVDGAKIKVKFGGGMDLDEDKIESIGFEATLFLDGPELLGEILKDQVPDWLTKLLGDKGVSVP